MSEQVESFAAGHLVAVGQLVGKYRELLRMRLARAEAAPEIARRDMRLLAERFPGALRELDGLPLDEVQARLGALEQAALGATDVPAWAVWLASYHGWLRAALRIRRLAGGCRDAGVVRQRLLEQYVPEPSGPDLARFDLAVVAGVLQPSHGRLSLWAMQLVADEHGLSVADLDDFLGGRRLLSRGTL